MIFLLVLLVVSLAVCFVVAVKGAVELVRTLIGRGEEADVLDEKTRALIDGDSPLPLDVAVRVNHDFADLINSSAELQQFDRDLKRFYVIGDER